MSIPLAETHITVYRVPADSGAATRDPWDGGDVPESEAEALFENVRAVISSPRGNERNSGGSQQVIEFKLNCDPIALRNTDRVVDGQGQSYEVVWVRTGPRRGMGLDHTEAGLRLVEGLA